MSFSSKRGSSERILAAVCVIVFLLIIPTAAQALPGLSSLLLSQQKPSTSTTPPSHSSQTLRTAGNVTGSDPPCPPGAASTGLTNCGNLTYHGGDVLHNPTNFLIFWLPSGTNPVTGNAYTFENTSRPAADSLGYELLISNYFADVCSGSRFYSMISQYTGTGAGSGVSSPGGCTFLQGPDTVTDGEAFPSNKGTLANPLTDGDMQDEIERARSSLSGWNVAGDGALFFVFLPLSVFINAGGILPGGGGGCAYHGHYGTGFLGLGTPVAYGVIPDLATADKGACGSQLGPIADNFVTLTMSGASHEQFEAVTDPFDGGWFFQDGSHEIGDECAYTFTGQESDLSNVVLNGHLYLVQAEWDNTISGCDVDPSGPPLSVRVDLSLFQTPAACCNPPSGFVITYQQDGDTAPASTATTILSLINGFEDTIVLVVPGSTVSISPITSTAGSERWCLALDVSTNQCEGASITAPTTGTLSSLFAFYDLLEESVHTTFIGGAPTVVFCDFTYSTAPSIPGTQGTLPVTFSIAQPTGTAVHVWVLNGSLANVCETSPTPPPTSGERWFTLPSTFSLTSPLTLPEITYYHQYGLTQITSIISDGSSPSNSPYLSYSYRGGSQTSIFSLAASNNPLWIDANSILFASIASGSNSEVWVTPITCVSVNLQGFCNFASTYQGTLISGAISFTFYHQYEQTVTNCTKFTTVYDPSICTSYAIIGGGTPPTPPTVTYTEFGQTKTVTLPCAPYTQYNYNFNPPLIEVFLSCNFWADAGSTASVTNPLPGSTSSEQWVTSTPSWTINAVNRITQPIIYLHQAITSTTTTSGSASADQTSITGVTITITASTASDGTPVTVTSTILNGQPPGTGPLNLTGIGFVDVKVTGITSGIARVCITNPSVIPSTKIQYWNGSAWVDAANLTVTGTTVCGDIPISALGGTPIAMETKDSSSISTTVVSSGGGPASSSVPLGTSVNDTSVVTATPFTPTGRVSYSFYSSGCTGNPLSTATVALDQSGNAPSSGSSAPLGAGNYAFQATYGGDTNYSGSTSSCETFVVNKAAPVITSTLSATSIPVDGSSSDTVAIIGTSGIVPTGSLIYAVYSDTACTIQAFTDTHPVGTSSAGFTPTTIGTYEWIAKYQGDSNYLAASTSCGAEPFQVTDFTLTASPNTIAPPIGVITGSTSIILTGLNGFNSTVTLSFTSSPGLTATITPAKLTGSGSASLTVSSMVTGTYTVIVNGLSLGFPNEPSHLAHVTVMIVAPDFKISASPNFFIGQNGEDSGFFFLSRISVTSLATFTDNVTLSATSAPSTPVFLFLHPITLSVPAGGVARAFLLIAIGQNASPGTYIITITGTGGSSTHSATITVIIPSRIIDFDSIIWTHTLSLAISGGNQTWIAIIQNTGSTIQYVQLVVTGTATNGTHLFTAISAVILIPSLATVNITFSTSSATFTAADIGQTFVFRARAFFGASPTNLNNVSDDVQYGSFIVSP